MQVVADLDDRVAGVFDRGIGDSVNPHVALARASRVLACRLLFSVGNRVLNLQWLNARIEVPVIGGPSPSATLALWVATEPWGPPLPSRFAHPVIEHRDPGDDGERDGEVVLPGVVLGESRAQGGRGRSTVPGHPGPDARSRVLHGEDGGPRRRLDNPEEAEEPAFFLHAECPADLTARDDLRGAQAKTEPAPAACHLRGTLVPALMEVEWPQALEARPSWRRAPSRAIRRPLHDRALPSCDRRPRSRGIRALATVAQGTGDAVWCEASDMQMMSPTWQRNPGPGRRGTRRHPGGSLPTPGRVEAGDPDPGVGRADDGTRHLSLLLLDLGGAPASFLGSTVRDRKDHLSVALTNPDRSRDGHMEVPLGDAAHRRADEALAGGPATGGSGRRTTGRGPLSHRSGSASGPTSRTSSRSAG